ncbi:MAG: efflux RND transporter permease subunit [Candidatus Omnitrophica bacterium]|nr:efflux RND transporter permease subunit [Candidatus Omnitrophota bacterium]
MTFSQRIGNHRRSILFTMIVLALAGFGAGWRMPVSLFPIVSFPRIVISIEAGDQPAERMAVEVTRPFEEAVRSVQGVRKVRSTTSRGSAEISVNFEWGEDMVSALLLTESALSRVRDEAPANTRFEIRRMDPTVFPVLGYSLTSDNRSLVDLKDLALYQIRPVLTAVPGVATVSVLGGEEREYHVLVDPEKLNALSLSLGEVVNALSASNIITAVGRLEEHNRLYLAVSNTQFENIDQIGQTILKTGRNGVIDLMDVAKIEKATVPQWTRVTADGHDAVLFQVYQQLEGNTVDISRRISRELVNLDSILPKDVKIANWYDQSQLILSSADSVRNAVILGVGLASIVLLFFLRSFKVTLIAAVSVPVVLAMVSLFLYFMGKSFNIMTLGGMAASVGLIIDDSIVILEHAIRRIRGSSQDYSENISLAVTEYLRPLAGSSASTIIIFAPLAFLSGVTGAFFSDLSLTMAIGLATSFLVALLVIPSMGHFLLSNRDAKKGEGGWLTERVHRGYGDLMRRVLPHPWMILSLLIPFLTLGWLAFNQTGSGFMPPMDEGGFVLDYRSAPGMSLEETDRLLRQIEEILKSTPEVQTYSRRTGIQLGGGLSEANEGDFFVRLKPQPRRGIEEVMDEVRGKIESILPLVNIEILQLMEDLIGDLSAVPQPIEIKIFSDDIKVLESVAPKVASAIEKAPGLVDVNDGIVVAGDSLNIQVDRNKAALEGATPDDVVHGVEEFLSGTISTDILSGPKMVGVRAWVPEPIRDSRQDIENFRLTAPDGHVFPLKRVADLEISRGQPQITREDFKQMAAVTARITGRDMGSTAKDVAKILDTSGILPKGVYYKMGGLYEQQRIAFHGLIIVMVAAVALVFILLLFLYESFSVAIALMITTLLAVSAVFIGLSWTHTELNITSMMGMTMIVGIVTEVGIIFYSEFDSLPDNMPFYERMIETGKNRMRPIAMTTLAAILALLPLAISGGEGASMEKPLAIAIISGLAVQLPLILLVTPSLLALFNSIVGHGVDGPRSVSVERHSIHSTKPEGE